MGANSANCCSFTPSTANEAWGVARRRRGEGVECAIVVALLERMRSLSRGLPRPHHRLLVPEDLATNLGEISEHTVHYRKLSCLCAIHPRHERPRQMIAISRDADH